MAARGFLMSCAIWLENRPKTARRSILSRCVASDAATSRTAAPSTRVTVTVPSAKAATLPPSRRNMARYAMTPAVATAAA